MKKKNLRIITLVLSAALLICAFAFTVGAESGNVAKVEGGEEYATFAEALTNVPEGGKITLIGNATMDATYTVTKSFTLDLGGKTLNVTTGGAFVINEAHDVTITGTGAINLAGNLISSITNAGVAYNFTVKGEKQGIDIFHSGTGDAQRIVYTKGGTNVFENVEVVSTATCDKTVRGAFQADNASGAANFIFNKFTYINENYATAQQALGFLYLGGASTATIDNSAIYAAGTIINLDTNTNTDVSKVLLDVDNSHIELITKKNQARCQLLYSGTDNNVATMYGTVYFKDSYLGGNCYRAIYSDTNSTAAFKVILDHSILSNSGANNEPTGLLTRGALIKAINGSTLLSSTTGLTGNGGAIQCEVGTRFGSTVVANASAITWINTEGQTVTGVKAVLDPLGDSRYPYVGLINGTSTYTFPGVSTVAMASYSTMTGAANNVYGHQVENSSGVGGDFTDFYEGYAKAGALTRYSSGTDSCFKYWICPTADASYGSTRKISTDPYFVFGDNNNYNNASAKISDTKVYVVEFDIASDPNYGFPQASIKITARTSGNTNCTTTEITKLNSDGSFNKGSLQSYNSEVKLSTTEWNHITFVIYTDPAAKTLTANGNATGGKTYIYVGDSLLGYFNGAYTNTYSTNNGTVTHNVAAYIQGPRFDITKTDHTVGEALYVDNLIRRTYKTYAASGESESAMNPEFYLNDNIPKNNVLINKNISVNGFYYATLDEALKAASATDSYVELKGNVTVPQIVTTNGNVWTNGYTLGLSNEGYGADVVLDGTTVTEYIFNENYTATTDYVIYTGDPDDNGQKADPKNYRTITVKMGRLPDAGTLTAYLDESAGNYKLADITGWEDKDGGDFAVVNLSKAFAEANATVTIYPKTSGAKVIASYVKDSAGKVLLGTTDDNGTNNALKALKDGEIIVLCADLNYGSSTYFGNKALDSEHGVTLDNDYTDEELAKMKAVAQVIGIDVNGFTVKVFNEATFIFASNNTVVNCYSSKEGGYIYSRVANIRSGNTEYGFYGLRIFGIYNGGKEEGANAMTVSNAHINVGAYNGMYRNNLTVSGGVLFEGLTGDNSCSINVDGVIGTRSVQDSSAAIITRAYWGKIIIKNSAILNPTGTHIIDLKVADAYKFNGAHPTPYLYIEDSILVNRGGETDPMVSDNSDSTEISIEYKNVIANGRLNPSNEGQDKVKVNEGVGGSNCALGTLNAPAGLKNVNYNVPMDLSKYTGKYIWKVQTPALISKTEGGVNDDIYVYIVTQGYENLVPAGAKSITLPNIKTITAFSSDIVKVNYADKDGKVEKTVEYKKGGNVNTAEYTAKTLTMNAITLNPTGEWEGETKNLQANVTLTSKYTAKSAVSGLKANLSLYTDFDINLYIPAKYKDYVSVSDGADNIVLVPVTVGGENYLKAVISRNADEAAVKASYVITVSEAGYTASTTASINITTYAEAILKGSYTDADKQLMMYMLEYANESAKYFGKDNSVIEAILTNEEYQGAKGEGTVDKSYAAAIENIGLSEVFSSASVKLTSAPAFVFTVNGNLTGKVTVEYAGNVKEYTLDGNSEIVIEGMKVYNFTSTLKITAEYQKDGETVTVSGSYNLDTYAKYHTEIASATPTEEITEEMINSSKACLALIEALYDYATVADIYTK